MSNEGVVWTRELIVERGPLVKVFAKKSKITYEGHITARQCDWPQVWFEGYDGTVVFEIAWSSLIRCLNEGVPIQF